MELAEAHVDKVETDLAKEKSRNILISKDLSALEKVSAYKVERLQADVQASIARADGAEKKCYENHLMHQVRYFVFIFFLFIKDDFYVTFC